MSLPKLLEEKLIKRLDQLIDQAQQIAEEMEKREKQRSSTYIDRYEPSGFEAVPNNTGSLEHGNFLTKVDSLLSLLFEGNPRLDDLLKKVNHWVWSADVKRTEGILMAIKDDLENGMLISLSRHLETNIASDYMQQAEDLLGEGISSKYDYVPAAVLSGAVLEKSLRDLCSRQNPPIALFGTNDRPKTLDPLITDLQKANVFSKAKADQLKSWAKIRNDAAHGDFATFSRKDVEDMISGIKRFLAEYL